MRLEQFERTLRRLTLRHDGLLASTGNGLEGVDPLRPWGYILRQAIHSADHHAMAYWSVEVEKKCLLLMCRLKSKHSCFRSAPLPPPTSRGLALLLLRDCAGLRKGSQAHFLRRPQVVL